MLILQHTIESAKSAKQFVDLCEESFEKKLSETVETVISTDKTKIITLSGPSCSGKTTTARKLIEEIEKSGCNARMISIDDFYRDNIRDEENADFESASALDLVSFNRFVSDLFSGKIAEKPIFDLGKGGVIGFEKYVPNEDDIYIFEGIQAVYPEITSKLSDFPYKSLFVSVANDVSLNGVVFEKHEIRLARRLVRDIRFRSTDFERTMKLWTSVRSNEEKNIFPGAENVEFRIDSFLPYELLYIGKLLIPETEKIPHVTEKYEALKVLKEKLLKTTNKYITEDMIPQKSMFREFIG